MNGWIVGPVDSNAPSSCYSVAIYSMSMSNEALKIHVSLYKLYGWNSLFGFYPVHAVRCGNTIQFCRDRTALLWHFALFLFLLSFACHFQWRHGCRTVDVCCMHAFQRARRTVIRAHCIERRFNQILVFFLNSKVLESSSKMPVIWNAIDIFFVVENIEAYHMAEYTVVRKLFVEFVRSKFRFRGFETN